MKAFLLLWSLIALVACGTANRTVSDHLQDSRFEPVHQTVYRYNQEAYDVTLYQDWFTERYVVVVWCPKGQAVPLGRIWTMCTEGHCLDQELKQFVRMRWDYVLEALASSNQ